MVVTNKNEKKTLLLNMVKLCFVNAKIKFRVIFIGFEKGKSGSKLS